MNGEVGVANLRSFGWLAGLECMRPSWLTKIIVRLFRPLNSRLSFLSSMENVAHVKNTKDILSQLESLKELVSEQF